jgi:hypothetical protein
MTYLLTLLTLTINHNIKESKSASNRRYAATWASCCRLDRSSTDSGLRITKRRLFVPRVCGGQVYGRGRSVVPKRTQEISPRAWRAGTERRRHFWDTDIRMYFIKLQNACVNTRSVAPRVRNVSTDPEIRRQWGNHTDPFSRSQQSRSLVWILFSSNSERVNAYFIGSLDCRGLILPHGHATFACVCTKQFCKHGVYHCH